MAVILLFAAILSAGALIGIIYLRWAHANYPKSWRWELLLMGVPFALGALFSFWVYSPAPNLGGRILFALAMGLTIVFLFRYVGLSRLTNAIPPRKPPKGTQ